MLRNFSIVTVLTTFFISTQYLSAASVDSGAQFEYRTFATCQEFESTLKQILPTTYNYGRTYELDGMMMAESSIANIPPTASLTDNGPKSDTNVQVK